MREAPIDFGSRGCRAGSIARGLQDRILPGTRGMRTRMNSRLLAGAGCGASPRWAIWLLIAAATIGCREREPDLPGAPAIEMIARSAPVPYSQYHAIAVSDRE